MRAFFAPRSGVDILSDQFLLAHYRCDEALSSDDLADYGPDSIDLAQTGTPALTDKVYDQAAGAGVGGRELDGSSDYFTQAGTLSSAQIDSMQGESSLYGWIELDNTSFDGLVIAVGGEGSGGSGNNYIQQLYIASGNLSQRWQHSSNTLVTHTSTGSLDAGTPYFVCVSRYDDPDNSGRYISRIRAWKFDNAYTGAASLVIDETSNNLIGTDSTTTAKITVGCSYTRSSPFNGKLTDVGAATCRLAPEWDRKQFALGVRNYRQDELVAGKAYALKARALINHDDTWKDLTDLEGHNFVKALSWSEHVDNGALASGQMTLKREFYYGSLARDMQSSIHNLDSGGSYLAMLDAKKQVKFETAVYPQQNRAPYDWEYDLMFEGFIRKPDWGKFDIKVDVDGKSQLVRDVRVDTIRDYSSDGVPENIEDVLQEQIDDNEPSTVGYLGGRKPTLVVLGTPSKSPGIFNLTKGPLLDAQQNLVRQIGWKVGYVWHDDRQEFLYTLWEPNKSPSSVRTLAASEVLDYASMSIDAGDLVTRCRVYYGDSGSKDNVGEDGRTYEEYIDTTARGLYGDLYGEINEGSYNLVDGSAEALDLATLVVTELGSPTLWAKPELLYQPWPELGDLVTLSADSRRFSNDTDLAIIGVNHTIGYGDTGINARTSLDMRGQAAVCGFRSWQMEGPIVRAGGAPPFPTHALPELENLTVTDIGPVQLVEWDWPVGRLNRGFDLAEVHVGTGSTFTPSDATLVGVTRGNSFVIVNPSLIGNTRYVKVVPRSYFRYPGVATVNANAQAFAPTYTVAVPRFRCYASATQALNTSGAWDRLVFGSIGGSAGWDVGSNLSIDSNRTLFNVPVDGHYRFSWRTEVDWAGSGDGSEVALFRNCTNDNNGTQVSGNNWQPDATSASVNSVNHNTACVELVAGDTVLLKHRDGAKATTATLQAGSTVSYWEGELIGDKN